MLQALADGQLLQEHLELIAIRVYELREERAGRELEDVEMRITATGAVDGVIQAEWFSMDHELHYLQFPLSYAWTQDFEERERDQH